MWRLLLIAFKRIFFITVKETVKENSTEIAEKMVDTVLKAMEEGAATTKFTMLDDRLARFAKAERDNLVKIVETFLNGEKNG